jgi:predicted ATPase
MLTAERLKQDLVCPWHLYRDFDAIAVDEQSIQPRSSKKEKTLSFFDSSKANQHLLQLFSPRMAFLHQDARQGGVIKSSKLLCQSFCGCVVSMQAQDRSLPDRAFAGEP